MNNNQVSAGYLLGILSVLFTPSTFASSVFLGHTSTQRLVTVGDTLQELSPAGTDLFLSYDINDSWSISADYSKLDDDDAINNVLNLTYEFDSKGLGLSYFGDDWSVNYQFSDFEEQQDTLNNRPDGNGAVRHNQGSAHSLSASYFLSLNENWQVSTSVGIHYNDWDESNTQILISPPNSDEPGNTMPMATEEAGDASLMSIAANLNRYTMLNENTGMTLGIFVGWNEVLDSQSELQSINNRNINAGTRGGNRGGTIDNFLISGGESYGIASMYLSFDFFDNWVVDLDFNTDFGTDDSIHTWSLGLGYLF